mgnify:CR=1 FL=1
MRKIILAMTLVCFCAGVLFAHGVGYREASEKSVALEFFYSTGEKMSYREARVFSPKDSQFAIQTGRTDELGRFAFIPDCEGMWRVIVRDEEGHQANAEINITPEFLQNNISPETQNNIFSDKFGIMIRALLGVSLIFNIAAFVKIFSRRR